MRTHTRARTHTGLNGRCRTYLLLHFYFISLWNDPAVGPQRSVGKSCTATPRELDATAFPHVQTRVRVAWQRDGWWRKKRKWTNTADPQWWKIQRSQGGNFKRWVQTCVRSGRGGAWFWMWLKGKMNEEKKKKQNTFFLYSADSHAECKYLKAQQRLTAGRPAAPAVMSPPCRCNGCMQIKRLTAPSWKHFSF